MNKNIVIAVVLTLIIAGSAGYAYGKGSVGDTSKIDKERQDSITMMKEQSASIKEMGEMMKSSGMTMQELGTKYKDDMMISNGKDLVMIGEKHMNKDEEANRNNPTMNQMMDN